MELATKSLTNPCGVGSKYCYFVVIILTTIVFAAFTRLIPPLQSPDENVHLLRAHLLSRGVIVLDAPPGKTSGGLVDEGLYHYATSAWKGIATEPNNKFTAERVQALSAVQWASRDVFAEIPTTGYYFPLIYTPQAIGLAIGEFVGMSVQQSYLLARYFAFTASLLLIFLACRLYPPSPLAIAVLVLPMNVFQMVSTSMDGVATALALVCISLFMRCGDQTKASSSRHAYALLACLFILMTSRIQVLAFALMPFILAVKTRQIQHFWYGLILSALTLTWLYIGIGHTIDGGVKHPEHSHFDLILHYLSHPDELWFVFQRTFSQETIYIDYMQGFIGVLGWLDTPFSSSFYQLVAALLVAITLLSISFQTEPHVVLLRVALLVMSFASAFTVFFALLIQWSPFPADVVHGVQGRYFTVPVVAFAYALSGSAGFKPMAAKLGGILIIVLLAVVIIKMPQVLLERYFISLV